VSDIKVTVLAAGEPTPQATERAVATGTKAWELFADDPAVIAARAGGVLKDLAYELSRSTAPTAGTSCGTRPRT
jgi:threonyl-tRNA synthetase